MNDTPADTAAKVAEHWARKLDAPGRHYMRGATRGRREDNWVNDCVFHHLADRAPVDRMLSIGCGRGELERHRA